MRQRIITLLVAVTALAIPGFTAASVAQGTDSDHEREIRTLLDQRDREIKALLQNKETLTAEENERLKTMINSIIDFEAMARTALGAHWSDLTPDQRREFVDVFSEIVRAQSLSNLDVYRTTVAYDRIDVNGSSAQVATSVRYKDVPTRVEYTMSLRDGAWRVDDVAIDGVSSAEGYARSFQPVVKKRGFDSLMASLRKKRDQVAANS